MRSTCGEAPVAQSLRDKDRALLTNLLCVVRNLINGYTVRSTHMPKGTPYGGQGDFVAKTEPYLPIFSKGD